MLKSFLCCYRCGRNWSVPYRRHEVYENHLCAQCTKESNISEVEDSTPISTQQAVSNGGKSDNVDPKQAQAVKKMSFDAVPLSLLLHAQPGNQNGADKYGVYNWLKLEDGSMSMSTYLNALQRHLLLFRAGQDNTSDTNINNLDSMISGLAVLRDAMLFNKVKDDRVKLSAEQIEILENKINNII